MVSYGDYKTFVVADIPGLIEGAHEGIGLGLDFLRHVERTKVLVHVVDVSTTGRDPVEDILTIMKELELYKPDLLAKPQMVVASKMDAVDEPQRVAAVREFCAARGLEFLDISSATGLHIKELIYRLGQRVEQLLEERRETTPPVA